MQLALLGAPCTGKEQFSALLSGALTAVGIAAEIAMHVAPHVTFKADSIFLMGLQSTHAQDVSTDRVLRQLLSQNQMPYQVLYGSHKECLAQAMDLIYGLLHDTQDTGAPKAGPPENRAESMRPWVWICDKCSDPQCEHRLLTGLLASRPAIATGQLP